MYARLNTAYAVAAPMNAAVIPVLLVVVLGAGAAFAQEIQFATYQETAQLVIDRRDAGNTTASITLQSKSNQEILVPSGLEEKIRGEALLISIIATTETDCLPGVVDESCILINVKRSLDWPGINAIHEGVGEIGGSLIGDINEVLGTEADFHSIYVHPRDKTGTLPGTDALSPENTLISAVYTMEPRDAAAAFTDLSERLLAEEIRNSDGFYKVAQNLAGSESADVVFSAVPLGESMLYQLRVSDMIPDTGAPDTIEPLRYLGEETLHRSLYFSHGFYPLNSLLNVLVLSYDDVEVRDSVIAELDSEITDGIKVPTDVTRQGWVFDPDSGDKIDAKFIFGRQTEVSSESLVFVLDSSDGTDAPPKIESRQVPDTNADAQYVVLGIIIVAGGAAAAFYLVGYRKKQSE